MQGLNHSWPRKWPPVLLVGCGVVGRAIAEAHALREVPFCLADQDEAGLRAVADFFIASGISVATVDLGIESLSAIQVGQWCGEEAGHPPIVIESIVEQLAAKQLLFKAIQQRFGDEVVLCSNTSTLLIDKIATDELSAPDRVCGLHFFMPVHQRAAVEVVAGGQSHDDAIDAIVKHAERIGKRVIRCHDGPGFIVNRMLSPYLNQSLLLLCRGATERQIERAALAYGMPMSPLELIDWIGAPTMYHAGKAFWDAFPGRIDPSPLVPALVKRKRHGRAVGRGLYDYVGGRRSETLADESLRLVDSYRTEAQTFADGDVLLLLAIPMWIEATQLLEEGITDSMATVDLAMAGGLGYDSDVSWSGFFDELGQDAILSAMNRWQNDFRSMRS